MRGKSFRKKVSSAKVTPSYPRKGRQRGMRMRSRRQGDHPFRQHPAQCLLRPHPGCQRHQPGADPGGICALGGEHRPVGGELGAAVGASLGALSGYRRANSGLLGVLGRPPPCGLRRSRCGGRGWPRWAWIVLSQTMGLYRRISPDARSISALSSTAGIAPIADVAACCGRLG